VTVDFGEGRRYSFRAVFLVALFFILVAPVFWRLTQLRSAIPEAYENADLYHEVYPTLSYGFARLAHGDAPLWNSKQLCGAPFLADPRTGSLQPLNALFLVAPTARALAAHAFLSIFLMGTFFTLFGRGLGLRYTSALLGGVVYALGGAGAAAVSRPGMANALVWSAFTLWAMREYLTHFRYRRAVLVGIGIALLVLSGANALACAMLSMTALYGLWYCVFPLRATTPPRWRNGKTAGALPTFPDRFAGLVIAGGIGLAVSAVQWAPTLAWVPGLEHSGSFFWNYAVAGQAPLNARELLGQLLIPRPGLLPHMGYIGLATVFLVPAAWFSRSRWRDVGLFTAAFLMCGMLFLWIPKSNPDTFPAAVLLYPAAFSLAILAALGANRLLSPRGAHSPRVWAPTLVLLVLVTTLFYGSGNLTRGYLIAFAVILVPATVLRLRWYGAFSGFLLAVLLVTDLGTANTNAYYHPYMNAPECYEKYAPSLRLAEEQALGGRAAIVAGPLEAALTGNLGLLTPLSLAGAAHASLTKEQARWWAQLSGPEESAGSRRAAAVSPSATTPQLLNVMAVRALVVSPASTLMGGRWGAAGPRLREVRAESAAKVLVNEDALPRAYWTPQWRVAAGIDGALAVLRDPTFDPATMCVLDSSSDAFSRVAENLPAVSTNTGMSYHDAPCVVTDLSGERVRVAVTAPQSGVLILADSYASGWKARLDGRPAPLARVNGLFRAVAMPAGEHEVSFEYDPFSFEVGRAISLASVTLLACAGIVVLSRAKR